MSHRRRFRPTFPPLVNFRRFRRAGHLHNASRALTAGNTDAVTARISAAQHQHVTTAAGNFRSDRFPRRYAVLTDQEFQREMNPLSLPAGQIPIARRFNAGSQHYGIKPLPQIGSIHKFGGSRINSRFKRLHPDGHRGLENHPLRLQLFKAPINQRLFQFEIRNPVPKQTARLGRLLKDRYFMPQPDQMLCAG